MPRDKFITIAKEEYTARKVYKDQGFYLLSHAVSSFFPKGVSDMHIPQEMYRDIHKHYSHENSMFINPGDRYVRICGKNTFNVFTVFRYKKTTQDIIEELMPFFVD